VKAIPAGDPAGITRALTVIPAMAIREALRLEAILFAAPDYVLVHDKATAPPWLIEFTETIGHVEIDGTVVTVLYLTDDPEVWTLFAKQATR